MNLPDAPIASEGFFVTHFFTVKDQEKSKDLYVRILGGKVIKPENPCYIKLANSWIVLNSGGGPTPDKPDVLLETPTDLNRVNSFLNLRVADIWACYKQWRQRSVLPHRVARQPRLGMALLHARSRRLPNRGRPIHSDGTRSLQKVRSLNLSTPHAARPIQIRWERHSKIKTYGNEIS